MKEKEETRLQKWYVTEGQKTVNFGVCIFSPLVVELALIYHLIYELYKNCYIVGLILNEEYLF